MELHKRVVKCPHPMCLRVTQISALSSCSHEAPETAFET